MKFNKLQLCCVCQKRRIRGYYGAIIIEYIKLARRKLKTKGKEIGWNEFICTSCEPIVEQIGVSLLKIAIKNGPKVFRKKKVVAKKRKPNAKKKTTVRKKIVR